jgi:ABC-2 family transporter protein
MICLIWRQHRGQALWTVITVTALCALIAGFGLSAEQWLAGYHTWLRQLAAAGCPPPTAHSGVFHVRSAATCSALKNRYPGSLQAAFAKRYNFPILFSQDGLPVVFAIIGAMIGAPLVAREVEQRTHLVAWTQSVSRRRWYITKIAALTAALALAGLTAGTANAWLQHPLAAGDTTSSRWSWFVSSNLALAGEAALAVALGVAFGALLRRTLPAIGATMAGFAILLLGARWTVLALTPATKTTGPRYAAPPGSWVLGPGTGVPVPYHPARPVLAAAAHPAHSPASGRSGCTGIGLARHPDARRLSDRPGVDRCCISDTEQP